ncbi:hypothetical protein GGE07_004018 [Sinorhizobium terangae]|uniref:hypothetical protein n=1 Tax=Sinorhizobium terangae TaxID=110322 RepID=UPI00142ED381|nr:hypothetical protein [Sinorhizobium terangae]MBB4187354.1 hypothetical protein [Sinorhizobium terangae]
MKTGAAESAGYTLAYDQAPLSQASRLISVQHFGSDLVLDAANTITGGTALPKTTFDYNDASGTGFTNVKTIAGLVGAPYQRRKFGYTIDDHYGPLERRYRTFWVPAVYQNRGQLCHRRQRLSRCRHGFERGYGYAPQESLWQWLELCHRLGRRWSRRPHVVRQGPWQLLRRRSRSEDWRQRH